MDYFNEIISNEELWDYYNELRYSYRKTSNVFNDSSSFIRRYLARGGKISGVLPQKYFKLLNDDNMRTSHTVSVFLLGILLHEKLPKLKNKIDEFMDIIEKSIDDNYEITPFSYYWFLICFFHDLGYAFEDYNLKDFFTEIKGVNKKFLSKGLPWRPAKLQLKYSKSFTKLMKHIVPRQIKESWRQYFIYTYVERKKLDHGILGGLLFFTDRYEQYYSKKKQYKRESFTDESSLYWSDTILYGIHLPIAWTILGHNMWFLPNNNHKDTLKYKEYNLDIMIAKEPVINMQYPFLFLLSLVDTLDPIKSGVKRGHDFDYILQNIELDFGFNKIKLKLTDELKKIINLRDVYNLQSWLQVEINNNSNNIEIVF